VVGLRTYQHPGNNPLIRHVEYINIEINMRPATVVSGNSVCENMTRCVLVATKVSEVCLPFIFMVEEKPRVEKIDLYTEKERPGPRLWANML
jgi:hypothetical protein